MNSVEAAPAAVGVAAPMVVPSEPVSIVVDEKLMVVLNKDGGVESMEINGGMALQVLPLPVCTAPEHQAGCAPAPVFELMDCQSGCCSMHWQVRCFAATSLWSWLGTYGTWSFNVCRQCVFPS